MIRLAMLTGITRLLWSGNSIGKTLSLTTPDEIEGPFYPVIKQKDKDADLTKIKGRAGLADGTHIIVSGKITDATGAAINNTTIDIWQANTNGRYRHPHDPNPAQLDPNFQGWAKITSGKDGMFRFKTVMPGAYPASETWSRPPHIHFKIFKRGYTPLTTQMYFPGEKLNSTDLLLNNKQPSERSLMIATHMNQTQNIATYQYNITLQKL